MVKILQGSVVMQNVLGGLTIHPPVANFWQHVRTKKLWQLVSSRKNNCNNKTSLLFKSPCMFYLLVMQALTA